MNPLRIEVVLKNESAPLAASQASTAARRFTDEEISAIAAPLARAIEEELIASGLRITPATAATAATSSQEPGVER